MTRHTEADVEEYLCARVKQAGGETRKAEWIGRRHCPDRYVLLNGGHWVELKRPGEIPRDGQLREHERIEKHGVPVTILDSIEAVDVFMEAIV